MSGVTAVCQLRSGANLVLLLKRLVVVFDRQGLALELWAEGFCLMEWSVDGVVPWGREVVVFVMAES